MNKQDILDEHIERDSKDIYENAYMSLLSNLFTSRKMGWVSIEQLATIIKEVLAREELESLIKELSKKL